MDYRQLLPSELQDILDSYLSGGVEATLDTDMLPDEGERLNPGNIIHFNLRIHCGVGKLDLPYSATLKSLQKFVDGKALMLHNDYGEDFVPALVANEGKLYLMAGRRNNILIYKFIGNQEKLVDAALSKLLDDYIALFK